jgi:hypothetical protein
MPPASPPTPSASPLLNSEFSKDLRNVARVVRNAFSTLMASAGLDPQDPQDLSRRWGVNKTLSWKIYKVVQTDDPYLALQQLPGREGVGVLLKKGQAAGLDPRVADATQQAVTKFDNFIEAHCGDRATFDIMGSDISPIGRQQRDEQHRRQLFEGASYLWGVQARTYLNIRMIAPGAQPGQLDIAMVSGLLDFRRLRESVRWPMFKRQTFRGNDAPLQTNVEALDPASAEYGVPFMLDFCPHPSKLIHLTRDASGQTTEISPGEVGNAGMTSVMVGAIEHGLPEPAPAGETDQVSNLWALLNTPAELLIYDTYFHKSLKYQLPPTAMLARTAGNAPPATEDLDHSRLPLFDPVVDLGPAVSAPITPEIAQYGQVFKAVFDRTGWNAADFHVFRLKMAYPPVVSGLAMQCIVPKLAK